MQILILHSRRLFVVVLPALALCLLLAPSLAAQTHGPMPSPPPEVPLEPTWSEWWRFNQASSLDWEEGDAGLSRFGFPPKLVREKVVPALLARLAEPVDPVLERQLLMALARIGELVPVGWDSKIWTAIEKRLLHPDYACSWTAVLSLGVLGHTASAETLLAILEDTDEARLLLDLGDPIDDGTRAFAAYALGLLGGQVRDPELCRRIVAALWKIYPPPRRNTPDLETAAVIAMGLIPLDPGASSPEAEEPRAPRTLQEQIRFLLAFATQEDLRGEWTSVHAHALRSVTRLYPGAPQMKEEIARALLPFVTRRGRRGHSLVRTGASMAMGFLGDLDDDPLDVEIRAALRESIGNARASVKVESFCALGRIGSRPGQGEQPVAGARELRQFLLRQAVRGHSARKPYAILAAIATEITLVGSGEPTSEQLLTVYGRLLTRGAKPDTRAAAAISLGLLGNRDLSPQFMERVPESSADPLNGYLALGLAWLEDESAVHLAARVLGDREADGECLELAALAAARIGELDLITGMLERLWRADSRETCAALARGLAHCGDLRLVDPLIETLEDEELPVLVRAHAAAVLGHLCASRPRPWEDALKIGLNFYAAPPTLTGSDGIGVLDFP